MTMLTGNAREKAFHEALSHLHGIFWDTKVDQLDIDRNHRYIISRMLNMGGMRGLLSVETLYNDDDIADAILHRRDINPRVRHFMAVRHHVSPEEIRVHAPQWR